MSMHALAAVVAFVCALLGIWMAGSLMGYRTDPVALVAWSIGAALVVAVTFAVFKSKET